MLRISYLCLAVLGLLLQAPRSERAAQTHAEAQAAAGDGEPLPSLDDLWKQYQALGLPVPHRDAKLVRYESGGGSIVNGKVQPKVHGLAFEVKPRTRTENPVLLHVSFEWQPSWNPHTQQVKPEPPSL